MRKFLKEGLRLRTACDLIMVMGEIEAIKPIGFKIPTLEDLEQEIKRIIPQIKSFAKPYVTRVNFDVKAKKKKEELKTEEEKPAD
jgi:hypothetical protein